MPLILGLKEQSGETKYLDVLTVQCTCSKAILLTLENIGLPSAYYLRLKLNMCVVVDYAEYCGHLSFERCDRKSLRHEKKIRTTCLACS